MSRKVGASNAATDDGSDDESVERDEGVEGVDLRDDLEDGARRAADLGSAEGRLAQRAQPSVLAALRAGRPS